MAQPLDHPDEVAVARRRSPGIARKCGDDALLVIADLPCPRGLFFRLRIGEMDEIAAHEPSWRPTVASAGLVIELGARAQPAIGYRSGERRHDQPAAEFTGELDRGLRERGDISRQRALHWFRRDRNILKLIMLAVV